MKTFIAVVLIGLSLFWLYRSVKGFVKTIKKMKETKKNKIQQKENNIDDTCSNSNTSN